MTLMFADDQIIIEDDNENSLQRGLYILQQILRMYGLEISFIKTKSLACKGCSPVRCKLVQNDQLIERVHSFRVLGCDLLAR